MLAAGRGRRFAAAGGGAFKQARMVPGGVSLVEHTCALYVRAGLAVTCALHPELEQLVPALRRAGNRVVLVAGADAGMGHSLAAAVAASPSPGGWLVALADMPAIRVDTIRAVAEALTGGAPLCAPFHVGRRGHPVGFAAGFEGALRALKGDEGARSVLETNSGSLLRIEVDDEGILRDVNAPADLDLLTGGGEWRTIDGSPG